jgi:hypothetical protein
MRWNESTHSEQPPQLHLANERERAPPEVERGREEMVRQRTYLGHVDLGHVDLGHPVTSL